MNDQIFFYYVCSWCGVEECKYPGTHMKDKRQLYGITSPLIVLVNEARSSGLYPSFRHLYLLTKPPRQLPQISVYLLSQIRATSLPTCLTAETSATQLTLMCFFTTSVLCNRCSSGIPINSHISRRWVRAFWRHTIDSSASTSLKDQ